MPKLACLYSGRLVISRMRAASAESFCAGTADGHTKTMPTARSNSVVSATICLVFVIREGHLPQILKTADQTLMSGQRMNRRGADTRRVRALERSSIEPRAAGRPRLL